MRTVRRPPAYLLAGQAGIGLTAGLLLLAALAGTVGVGGPGWAVGVAFLLGLTGLLVRAVARSGRDRLGPADAVTLARAVLVGALAALVADSVGAPVAARSRCSSRWPRWPWPWTRSTAGLLGGPGP